MRRSETLRLLTIINEGLAKRQVKVARTAAQIEDIKQRGVESAWKVIGGVVPEVIEFPAASEPSEHVVGCFPIVLGESPVEPDNRIGACAWGCGRAIQYRPYVPDHIVKACLYCVAERLESGDQ